MTYDLDLNSMKMNNQAKYLGQRSSSSKVIAWTHTNRHTDTPNRVECSTWTTEVVGSNVA